MSIRYPSGTKIGRLYEDAPRNSSRSLVPISDGARGMSLEQVINDTNDYYNQTGRALVFKKPTPINIVHVEYPKRSAAVIREAYFQKPSTVDYSGVYKARALEFEAKETKLKTSFPLDNIHEHQINHLQKAQLHGAIAFIIVHFSTLGKTYWIDAQHIIEFYRVQNSGGRKSIPLHAFEQFGYEIPCSFGASVDYLQIIDRVLFESKA